MMGRTPGTKLQKPPKISWVAGVDVAEDALIEMVGRVSIPDEIRDELALIADPLFKLLRQQGRR
jgi:hypothetical protein